MDQLASIIIRIFARALKLCEEFFNEYILNIFNVQYACKLFKFALSMLKLFLCADIFQIDIFFKFICKILIKVNDSLYTL